jgi:hypothetical protein
MKFQFRAQLFGFHGDFSSVASSKKKRRRNARNPSMDLYNWFTCFNVVRSLSADWKRSPLFGEVEESMKQKSKADSALTAQSIALRRSSGSESPPTFQSTRKLEPAATG